jgi:magnesium-transporting ATPase (P-type)
MGRPPRRAGEALLSRFLVWRIAFVSMLMTLGIFGMFKLALWHGADEATARTVAVNTLVVMEVFYLFSVRFLRTASLTFQGVLGTRPVLIAVAVVTALQLVFTYAPFMEALFDTRPLGVMQGLPVLAAGVLLFAVLEIEKLIRRQRGSQSP